MAKDGLYLGKIKNLYIGHNGDGRFGLYVELSGEFGVGTWAHDHPWHWSERCQWSAASRNEHLSEIPPLIASVLISAGKRSMNELLRTPVEITVNNGVIRSWRILTEVL